MLSPEERGGPGARAGDAAGRDLEARLLRAARTGGGRAEGALGGDIEGPAELLNLPPEVVLRAAPQGLLGGRGGGYCAPEEQPAAQGPSGVLSDVSLKRGRRTEGCGNWATHFRRGSERRDRGARSPADSICAEGSAEPSSRSESAPPGQAWSGSTCEKHLKQEPFTLFLEARLAANVPSTLTDDATCSGAPSVRHELEQLLSVGERKALQE